MTVTADSFVATYREFEPLHEQDEALVESYIAMAERRISPSWPEDTRDDMVMLQAAHMLSMSPMGRNARLSEPGKKTAFQEDLELRKKAHAYARSRVVGGV